MRYPQSIIAAFAAFAVVPASASDPKVPVDVSAEIDSREQRSELILLDLADDYPGLNATVYSGSEIAWDFAHGLADLSDESSVTSHTRFNVYSTAKGLTGLAFAKLVAKGEVSLSTKVADVAPDLPENLHQIELRHILSHTSGVRHYSSPGDWLKFASLSCDTPQQAISHFAGDALLFEPGEKQGYSTYAYVLASELLMRITDKQDFASALNFALGGASEFSLDNHEIAKANPYVLAGLLPNKPEDLDANAIVDLPPLSAECKFGGGGIVASSQQLARAGAEIYLADLFDSSGDYAGFAPMSGVSDVVFGAALGSGGLEESEIHSWQLSGGAPGGRSYLLVLVEPQVSVAIAGNFDGPNMAEAARKLGRIWSE